MLAETKNDQFTFFHLACWQMIAKFLFSSKKIKFSKFPPDTVWVTPLLQLSGDKLLWLDNKQHMLGFNYSLFRLGV